jgi:ribosomal protein S18 acetylase RimI-like enzyme
VRPARLQVSAPARESFEVCRMRAPLAQAPAIRRPADGTEILAFDAVADRRTLHGLLAAGYADGGGAVSDFGSWWPWLSGDSEYDPALIFMASEPGHGAVGAVICWTSGFVKDLVVVPGRRERGIGGALLGRAMAAIRTRGASAIELKVDARNSAAVALYRALGFVTVERIAMPGGWR